MSGEQEPDCYLVIKMGDQVINDEEKTLRKDTQNPKWYADYQFACMLPGPATLRIEIWEHNEFMKDEFIGYTEIDCEDRFLNKKWCRFPLEAKPIESRAIESEDGFEGIGRISCFMELIPMKYKSHPRHEIEPPPKLKCELRIIIWETKNCKHMDEKEQCNDLFVRCYPRNVDKMQDTDTHFRCR